MVIFTVKNRSPPRNTRGYVEDSSQHLELSASFLIDAFLHFNPERPPMRIETHSGRSNSRDKNDHLKKNINFRSRYLNLVRDDDYLKVFEKEWDRHPFELGSVLPLSLYLLFRFGLMLSPHPLRQTVTMRVQEQLLIGNKSIQSTH